MSLSSRHVLMGLETHLNGPTMPSVWTHPSHVTRNKNLHQFSLESPLLPHPFSNPLSNRHRARIAAVRSTTTALAAAETRRRATLCSSAVACLPISPLPLITRCRVLRADTTWSTATAPAQRSSLRPAACMSSSSFSTTPERPLLATAIPHQVGRGHRRRRVSSVFQVFQKYVFKCFIWDIAYVAMTIYTCCKYMFQVFQLFHTYVSNVLSRCCRSISKCCITCMSKAYVSGVS
jgi:hypothetical protein